MKKVYYIKSMMADFGRVYIIITITEIEQKQKNVIEWFFFSEIDKKYIKEQRKASAGYNIDNAKEYAYGFLVNKLSTECKLSESNTLFNIKLVDISIVEFVTAVKNKEYSGQPIEKLIPKNIDELNDLLEILKYYP